MQSLHNFIVEPIGERYDNTTKVGDKELILNTDVSDHSHVNRLARVVSVPRFTDYGIKEGDTVIVHFNVFRRWYDVKGRERNSRSYYKEDRYFVNYDQIFLYKRDEEWICPQGYCFVQPIKDNSELSVETERPLVGIVKHTDGRAELNSLVGFRPNIECEFVIDGKRLYRIPSQFITIKYEYQGDEEEYNPSWAKSG
tara:strand:- start:205 stop:795 length:591 start_codon:yes stop_codon:yes gene_type:complete